MRCLKAWQVFYYLNLPQLLEMTENNTCEQTHIENKSPIQNCCGSLQYGFEFWQNESTLPVKAVDPPRASLFVTVSGCCIHARALSLSLSGPSLICSPGSPLTEHQPPLYCQTDRRGWAFLETYLRWRFCCQPVLDVCSPAVCLPINLNTRLGGKRANRAAVSSLQWAASSVMKAGENTAISEQFPK